MMKNATDKNTEPTTTIIPFDPRALRALPGAADLLPGVADRAVALVAGAAVGLLAAHPGAQRGDVAALAHQLWGTIRGLEYGDARGWTVERAMAEAMLPGPIAALQHLLTVLLAAGDLKATLTRQRDALTGQIERLDVAAGQGAAR